jgi:hypothetical protein
MPQFHAKISISWSTVVGIRWKIFNNSYGTYGLNMASFNIRTHVSHNTTASDPDWVPSGQRNIHYFNVRYNCVRERPKQVIPSVTRSPSKALLQHKLHARFRPLTYLWNVSSCCYGKNNSLSFHLSNSISLDCQKKISTNTYLLHGAESFLRS